MSDEWDLLTAQEMAILIGHWGEDNLPEQARRHPLLIAEARHLLLVTYHRSIQARFSAKERRCAGIRLPRKKVGVAE